MIIIENAFISQIGKAGKNQISLANDYFIGSLKELSSVIHKNGTKAVMQISHAGSMADKNITISIKNDP